MSMENAILEHAGALKELAAAVRSLVDATMGSVITGAIRTESKTADTLLQDKAAELAAATEQRVAAAREAQKKDAEAKKPAGGAADETAGSALSATEQDKPDAAAEVVKAVSDEIEEKGTVATELVYEKDVRPVLLAAIKKVGKDSVAAMLKTYGVEKADKLAPEQLPAVLAEAQKLAA